MTKVKKDDVVNILVDRILNCIKKKNMSPRINELMKGIKTNRGKDSLDTGRLFQQVRRKLENTYGLCICSLSEEFYNKQKGPKGRIVRKSFKERPPKDLLEARRCIPGGGGRLLAGIYIPKQKKHDLIYESWVLKYTRKGLAETTLNVNRAQNGIRKNVLPVEETAIQMSDCFMEHFGKSFANVIKQQITQATKQLENGDGKKKALKK